MAQATILAIGDTAATSTDVVVASGESVTIGIFSDQEIINGTAAELAIDTPADDLIVHWYNQYKPVITVVGPGSYRVHRKDGFRIGVFTES